MIEAWNKLDALDEEARDAVVHEAARREDVVTVSALTGEGVERLQRALSERLSSGSRIRSLTVDPGDGAAVAWLHAHGEVLAQEMEDEALAIDVRLSDADYARFVAR